jgi:superoxide dismutase, Fe-Mn family
MIHLQELPYPLDALEPVISVETVGYHYEKHHAGYVDTLNKLITGTDLENKTLLEIIQWSTGPTFNAAAQIWNHDFYWDSLAPVDAGWIPSSTLASEIQMKWGTLDACKEALTKSALANFWSGWTWLVKKPHAGLEIVNTSWAQTPITGDDIPLLVVDVWEHAYYIDYRNRRVDYLQRFWDIVHWTKVSERLAQAIKQ